MFEMYMFMCKLQEVQNHIVNFNIFCSTIILFYALLFLHFYKRIFMSNNQTTSY